MKLLPGSAAARRALAASALLLLSAAAQADEPQWASGKYLYDNLCGHCHAPEVGVGTSITGRGLPVAFVEAIVRNGFNAMPAFPASYIDDESIAKVTEYIASLPPAEQP